MALTTWERVALFTLAYGMLLTFPAIQVTWRTLMFSNAIAIYIVHSYVATKEELAELTRRVALLEPRH